MPERQIDRVPAWYPALLIGPGLLVAFLAITADFIGLGIPRSGFNLQQQTLLTLGLIAAGLGTLIHRKAACDHLRKQRQYWKTAAFCAFPLLLLIVACEIGIRIHLLIGEESLETRREFNRKWHSAVSNQFYQNYESDYPYLPYRVRPKNRHHTNRKGYRGADFDWNTADNITRVACVGGSTTWEGTYPAALQQELNRLATGEGVNQFEVLNFGAESWTTVESLINYVVRGIHAQPDIIVVYHAINDVVAASYPSHVAAEPDYSHWRKRLQRPPSNIMAGLPLALDQSSIICLARNILYRKQAEHTWSKAIRNYPFEGTQVSQGTSTFHKNIESFVAIAQSQGATVVLVTQVHSPRHSRETCGNDTAIERVAMMNEVLRDVAVRHDQSGQVILIDAADAAADLQFYDEMHDWCHFSKAGYTQLGQFIARSLSRKDKVVSRGNRIDLQ